MRPTLTALLLSTTITALACAPTHPSPVTPAPTAVTDLEGHPADPFANNPARRATVLLFITTDCPISNGYAPEIRRLHETFSEQGIAFYLVYPDPDLTPADAKKHHTEYAHTAPALLDPKHELVKRAGVDTTPEAAVFTPDRAVIYRGRINDQYVDYGKSRPAPTTHDLRDVLDSIAAGRPLTPRTTPAVGCPIPL